MISTHKALIQSYYQALNDDAIHELDELVASNYQHHIPGLLPGLEAFKQVLSMYRYGFPDIEYHIEEIIEDGVNLVSRVSIQGSHQGNFLGHPPTERKFTAMGIDIFYIQNDKIAKRWGLFDTMSMLQQLGLYKPMG